MALGTINCVSLSFMTAAVQYYT